MTKTVRQSDVELTTNPHDRDPHHKKQRITTGAGKRKRKDVVKEVKSAARVATRVALKLANAEARRLKKKVK